MKVLYDHQIFMLQRFGGISRYFYELMRHSAQLFDYLVSGAFALSHNEYIDALQLPREFPLNMQLTDAQKLILNYADALIKTKECDVIHPTYYDPYILRNKNKPLVITVHDMIHELFPEYFTEDKTTVPQKKQMIHAADHIIAISQNTKSDILKLYPEISENKISVVYHGAPTNTIDNKEKPCGNYILFTGQRWIYKNFYNFISAVAPLLIKYDLRLICTGTAFNQNEQELLKNLDIHDRTTCLFADDKTLTELYSAATAFVFPSIYEGFGLPILEAFSAGGGGGAQS
ncbi:MAG: glycosyltransferase family 4 protein [Candidatus Margulisbacteria bacterium]|jgi:glycosyltransferase involved in cell wall biosynthesis|nr:glycosyltransferase family 4 protein [Candidatus Margulisiibacteriota bacterium]